jgi:ribose-phosphate pyrophosphokinase
MKTYILNLTNPVASHIVYEHSKFPDGQQSITLTGIHAETPGEDFIAIIESRMTSFLDVEMIICANQALRQLQHCKAVELFVPYFLGARSDRRFVHGSVNYLKEVICPIINSQNFKRVSVVDPHSDVLEACLNNFHKMNNHFLVSDALIDISGNMEKAKSEVVLVSPDAGAYKKIFDVAKAFELEEIITATKVRDLKTGKILHTDVPLSDKLYYDNMKFVIVDDICDGGRTFIEIAKAINIQAPGAKIYLVVTHGIFSAGFEQLNDYFHTIYTTNSVKDVKFLQDKSLVKQTNIFYK